MSKKEMLLYGFMILFLVTGLIVTISKTPKKIQAQNAKQQETQATPIPTPTVSENLVPAPVPVPVENKKIETPAVKNKVSSSVETQSVKDYFSAAGVMSLDGKDDSKQYSDKDIFSATKGLTVSAWINPATLQFAKSEGTGYVHWLGKGKSGAQEWIFRMYNKENSENRPNRISFYVFNKEGGWGIGSYFQDAIKVGQWIHVVGKVDGKKTYIYKNGALRDNDVYSPEIKITNCGAPLSIGSRDKKSFFEGKIANVRVYNRALSGSEITAIYNVEKSNFS
ncbi:MAG: LamG domain-containing protein [Patescibacteria group bacterium]